MKLTALLPLALGACTPLAQTWAPVEAYDVLTSELTTYAPADPASVRVVTWNMKYGWGRNDIYFDGWGDLAELDQLTVQGILNEQIAMLEHLGADIVLLQEVDERSKRSAYIRQADYLLQNSPYNYAAYIPIWDAEYVAQSGMGPTEMGQVVLSRWPITENLRIDQPVSDADPIHVRYFAPRRAIQQVQIDFGGGDALTLFNVHPTAYSLDGTKLRHLAQIYDRAAEIDGPVVVGGDFNVIPPGSVNPDRFDDVVDAGTIGVTEVTYTDEEMAALVPFYDTYQPVVALADYQAAGEGMSPTYDQSYDASTCAALPDDQRRYFTHSLSSQVFWNQKLDYLFTSLAWSGGATVQCRGDGGALIEPMSLSDHAAVVGDLVRR